MPGSVGFLPLGRADDLVAAHLSEFGLNLDPTLASRLDLELEDLTGLVRAASDGRALPPQHAVRDATPLRLFRN